MLKGLVLSVLIAIAFAVTPVRYDLNAGRDASYKVWCRIVVMPHHRGWSVKEPKQEHTNITMSLFPYIAKGFQLTCATDEHPVRATARIVDADSWTTDGMFQFLQMRLYWWWDVFPMYLGMADPVLVNISRGGSEHNWYCDVQR